METINQFATDYAGLLAVVGFILTVITGIAAVYFYYNPKQSTYRVSYKVFSPTFIGRRFRFHSEPGDGSYKTVSHYVDFWNSGSDTISEGVIREHISVALQSSSRMAGTELLTSSVVHETHPGISNFLPTIEEGRVVVRWSHFDPGMGVRIKIDLNSKENSDQLAVFGQGLRLQLKRVRHLSEIGGLADGTRKATVVGVPLALALALGGPAVDWFTTQEISGLVSYLAFFGLVVVIVALVLGGILAGLGVNTAIDWVFNARSPTEILKGEPRLYSGSLRVLPDGSVEDPHILALSEELRAAERFAEHRELRARARVEQA
ncbi:MAG: hypothetical protein V4701_07640 [Pseudomonadota bacterium]